MANYTFRCISCNKQEERNIPMDKYDKEKNKQICSCGEKMKRVIEWSGIAEGKGDGWCGKSTGNTI